LTQAYPNVDPGHVAPTTRGRNAGGVQPPDELGRHRERHWLGTAASQPGW